MVKKIRKGVWVKGINRLDYVIVGSTNSDWVLEEYPSGFKLKVPKNKIRKIFKVM